jgi:hypothetical protein
VFCRAILMNKLTLARDQHTHLESPSVEDVLAVMRTVEMEDDGPPEFQIEFCQTDTGVTSTQSYLSFFMLFDMNDSPSEWLVEFLRPRASYSEILGTCFSSSDHFVQRSRCGVFEMVRQSCLLKSGELVTEAVNWFLREGTPHPSLTWLHHDDAVRDI